jgi:hypothetical protein
MEVILPLKFSAKAVPDRNETLAIVKRTNTYVLFIGRPSVVASVSLILP